jgi:hypothetical protein
LSTSQSQDPVDDDTTAISAVKLRVNQPFHQGIEEKQQFVFRNLFGKHFGQVVDNGEEGGRLVVFSSLHKLIYGLLQPWLVAEWCQGIILAFLTDTMRSSSSIRPASTA